MYTQLITSYKPEHKSRCLDVCRAALDAGISAVQLSWSSNDLETLKLGEKLRRITWRAGASLVVNNRVDLAIALGADAVHLGQSDIFIPFAKRLAPKSMKIGLTVSTPQELIDAELLPVDYYGMGAVYASKTKTVQPIGIKALASMTALTKRPVVAIGGVTAAELAPLSFAGASGFAVIGAIYDADCAFTAASHLVSCWGGDKLKRQA